MHIGSILEEKTKFEAFDEFKSLCTFLGLMTPRNSTLTSYVSLVLLPKLRCLRVLSLSRYCITELPKSIPAMKHLSYLDLSDTLIRCLPESTSTLYNLQTLLLKNCSCLKKLPTAMANLVNLRLLDITNANAIKEMPSRVGKLTSLQKLSNFIVGDNIGSKIRELMNLKNLRGTLCISRLENVIDAEDARETKLIDKQYLDVLVLEWSDDFYGSQSKRYEKKVLDMVQPDKMLKELTIKCYGGMEYPMWMGDSFVSGMVVLRIETCVKCTYLPLLGQLPLLKELCIKGMDRVNSVGIEFYGNGCPKPFPSSKTTFCTYARMHALVHS